MSYRFSRKRPALLRKAEPEDPAILEQLRAFLDAAEPELVAFLVHLWGHQGSAVTYRALREAILRGDLEPAMVEAWQLDYARFVRDRMAPLWEEAMTSGARSTVSSLLRMVQTGSQAGPAPAPLPGLPLPGTPPTVPPVPPAVPPMAPPPPPTPPPIPPVWRFNPMEEGVRRWIEERGAAFVTSSTMDQIEGLRAVIQQAARTGQVVDDLARVIRPMVGLYHGQAVANLNYYNHLIASGMSREKALEKALLYAGRQHRYRAFMIARTELAFAYNQGAWLGTKQAMEAGMLPPMVKVWCTSRDERACPVCAGLHGMRREMDEPFPFHTRLADPMVKMVPPAHPNCRCTVQFVEKRRTRP